MQQPGEAAEVASPTKQVRYRKFNLTGSTAMVYTIRNQKLTPKEFQFEEPKEKAELAINIKLIEADYYQKYKIDNGIKSLLRAYDENRKRSSAEGMNRLGLDIIKIKSFSTSNTQKLTRSSDSAPKIPHHESARSNEHKIMTNREFLSPLKLTSIKMVEQNPIKQEQQLMPTEQSTNGLSQTVREGRQKQRKTFKKRAEQYLYKKLEGTEKQLREEQNVVYDKRIKSYLELLWKNMLSHNIYINLDLKCDDIASRPKKWKAYIAAGNNGAMIKGLIKRRFWWSIVDERTPDCNFVWTQLKIPEIFERQKKASPSKPRFRNQQEEDMPQKQIKIGRLKLLKLKSTLEDPYLAKILNKHDEALYKQYKRRYEEGDKERQFSYRVQRINKELSILGEDEYGGLIHNHLINNFFLGNKKALFYNLREYYSLSGDNLYNYIPLTFHIKKGLKDPEYIKFVDFYKRRQRLIDQERRQEEEEGAPKHKMRNIWIVKPGENSNQGRGITVIDEVYELNSLIKQGERHGEASEEQERTYIVQMYIDRPLLYNNRKFDIRHYMMISNFFGVTRAYWYEEGYIRTSSYEFDIHSFEPEIHLTNDAVQKRYPDYHKYEPFNKISYEEFQRYLDTALPSKKYNFKEQILPQMKKMGTDAVRSVFTKISPGNLMNNFEIFGLDFMIDANFKPWLIEINTNPCLECACPLLNRIIPYMAELSFKLTLDLAFPPPTHYPNTSKHLAPLISLDTFKYQLIFDSQVSGDQLQKLYRRSKNNLVEQIGEIEDDEIFKDDGKECKLDDFT